jgi:hypothetical protein
MTSLLIKFYRASCNDSATTARRAFAGAIYQYLFGTSAPMQSRPTAITLAPSAAGAVVMTVCGSLTMSQRHKHSVGRESTDEQAMRDQEVLRANRELAAYFKGKRTEREARTALKIIKAFVRDRERMDSKSRPALPGLNAKIPEKLRNRHATNDTRTPPRRSRRRAHQTLSKKSAATSEPKVDAQPAAASESDELP